MVRKPPVGGFGVLSEAVLQQQLQQHPKQSGGHVRTDGGESMAYHYQWLRTGHKQSSPTLFH